MKKKKQGQKKKHFYSHYSLSTVRIVTRNQFCISQIIQRSKSEIKGRYSVCAGFHVFFVCVEAKNVWFCGFFQNLRCNLWRFWWFFCRKLLKLVRPEHPEQYQHVLKMSARWRELRTHKGSCEHGAQKQSHTGEHFSPASTEHRDTPTSFPLHANSCQHLKH